MNEMNDELEYAQMLEIPVSTVNVVKKKSVFARKGGRDELKENVIGSVNRRVDGATFSENCAGYVQTESVAREPQFLDSGKGKRAGLAGKILMGEAIAACLIAAGIFVTNIFIPNTVINAFMGGLNRTEEKKEASYTDFKLTPVTSELSDTAVSVTGDGVICFTDATNVYPVCDGKVASVSKSGGLYTVKIAHTSSFSSVVTGLETVYYSTGDEVKSNLPFAYSNGENEVRVSMYDGEQMLNCYSLSGAVPVWNS